MAKKGRKPGEFNEQRERHLRQQRLWDLIKKISDEGDAWATLNGQTGIPVRYHFVKEQPEGWYSGEVLAKFDGALQVVHWTHKYSGNNPYLFKDGHSGFVPQKSIYGYVVESHKRNKNE